ncbi:hypothetical protein F070042J6_20400 [Bacteroides sp. f07]|uniref:lipopolysaccharide kinase InaA family protein n=1 Tax=Bacteroides sp. f07 TaxID=3132704 RepID=UPI0034C4E1B6
MKILINPAYERFRPFVEQLSRPLFFARHGKTLHDGRNVVKLFEVDGVRLAVKSYVRLSACNRMLYGTLRKSKAMRAYLYADRLRRLGIDTPEEVAVVEIRRRGMMRQCYFVSLYTDYESIRPATELFMQREEAKSVLDGVAGFLVRLHWAGVEHKDLNVGNILYKKESGSRGGGYGFQVIDTNRMSFRKRLSMRRRLRNMRRLSCSAPAYLYILHRYAEALRTDADGVQFKGVVCRLAFEWRQRTKGKIKGIFRRSRSLPRTEYEDVYTTPIPGRL